MVQTAVSRTSSAARPLGLAATALVAIFVATHDGNAQPRGVTEIEGAVANVSGSCPTLRFTIAGKSVVTHAGTDFDDGACADLANGRRVEVEGELQDDGTLLAREVDLD